MDDLVLIKIFNARWEAEVARSILKLHNIRVVIRSDDEGGMMPSLQMIKGVQVLVNKQDREKARTLLS